MRTIFAPILLTLPLLAAGCATYEPEGGPPIALVNSAGQSIGTVEAWETPGGVSFRLRASGLPHGVHGIHVHQVGRCEAPNFESAGGHWNPDGRKHGFNDPAGPHRGDLPNITVPATGVLAETISMSGASLSAVSGGNQMLDADGAALVIHAQPDDYMTDPSGNSGARIACAVIQRPPVPAR
jgi:Cu-Zn family superoxide dismutase